VHADEARQQSELLRSRLQALGGSASASKSILAQAFSKPPAAVQMGVERTTQNLILAFAMENAGVAMYEALRIAAGMAGDAETVSTIERIQTQEQEAAEKMWKLIAPAAERGCEARRKEGGNMEDLVVYYLQSAQAAEKGLADAFSGFSRPGEQKEVQALIATMSSKAKSQEERLAARLKSMGASPAETESSLARMLTFAPDDGDSKQDDLERSTQHLVIAYAAAAAEMALYEALQTAAKASGDGETLKLAKELQLEESEDHRLAWEKLPEAARTSSRAVLSTV
jgi:ferritin-like metal-binding protein YciE